MINFFKIYWGHLRSSKKSIIISMFGLIFAIAIVSSSILYIDTAKTDIIDTIITNSNDNPYEVELQISTGDLNISFSTLNTQITDLGNQIMKLAGIDFLDNIELFYSISQTYIVYYRDTNHTPGLRPLFIMELNNGINQDLKSFLNASSSLPTKTNGPNQQGFLLDVFFGSSSNADILKTTQSLNGTFNQGESINVYYYEGNKTLELPISLTGYGKIINYDIFDSKTHNYETNYNSQTYHTLSKVWQIEPSGIYASYLFVQNLTQFLVNNKKDFSYFDNSLNRTVSSVMANIIGGYRINYDKFDPFTIGNKINQIKKLQTTIKDKIYDTEFYKKLDKRTTYLNIQFIDYSKLIDVLNIVYQILYEMFLYALPMMIIALLVTNFSFGLIQKKFLSHFGIYKTRGTTGLMLFFFQLLDYLIIILGSAFTGMILGIPVSNLVVRTKSILNFSKSGNYDVITNFLTILPFLFIILFITSIFLGFLVSFRRIIRLSKISIAESENPTEKQDPFWKVHYLDIYLFLFGFISYFIINYLLNSPSNNLLILTVGIFFLIFFLPGPFAIVIGTVLLANRVIPIILDRTGTLLWEKNGSLLAFSFKNVIRHKNSTNRAIILIASLVTFLILFYATPYSQLNYENKVSQYQNGGDIQLIPNMLMSGPVDYQSSINTLTEALQNRLSMNLQGISPVLTLPFYANGFEYNLMFINSSTYYDASSVSLFHLGLKNSLKDDLEELSNSNNTVIIPKYFKEKMNVDVGDNLSINIPNHADTFKVIDSYSEWPMTSRNQLNTFTTYIILDITYFYNVLLPTWANNQPYYYILGVFVLNFKPGTDLNAMSQEMIKVVSGTILQSKTNLDNWDKNSILVFNFRLGQINIDLIMSLIISVAILLMFAYMQLNDRRQEIFTERALGMKIHQTAFLFYIESTILILCSIIIGSIISYYFMTTLAIFLTGGYQIPKYEVIIPLNLVFWTFGLLVVITSIISVIPAFLLGRNDIIQSFTYEN